MMIVMDRSATVVDTARVTARLEQIGCKAHISRDEGQTIIGVVGGSELLRESEFEAMPGVMQILATQRPFRRSSREFHPLDTQVAIGDLQVGGKMLAVIAGPCAVENSEQMLRAACAVRNAGAHLLRGGAFKPRTSPYSFQGLGEEGLRILATARERTGLPVVSEVTQPDLVPLVSEFVDVLQIGARNMQNFALLQAVGKTQRPVLLKRGMMSTVEELLMAAEYVLSQGNARVLLCERGIRTFETYTRNTIDINAVPLLKKLTHLPVFVDPSHGTGRWDLVTPIALAGIAAGADGLMIEVHPDPDTALSDGSQSLKPERFVALMEQLRPIADAMGRTL